MGRTRRPVKRGVWVAKAAVGKDDLRRLRRTINPVDPDTRGAKTLREQLALHRPESASCAACHAKFDPYGFALESFDVDGARTGRTSVLSMRRGREAAGEISARGGADLA